MRWVLAQRLPASEGSLFPYYSGPGIHAHGSRSAWCYGDPGVAATLLVAARAVGEQAWEDEAVEIAEADTARPLEQTGISDASLCHGAAGLAHLYNRLHHATGRASFEEAARAWYGRIYDHLPPKETGMLEGSAGVGLALLGAATDVEPSWDRVMLLSGAA